MSLYIFWFPHKKRTSHPLIAVCFRHGVNTACAVIKVSITTLKNRFPDKVVAIFHSDGLVGQKKEVPQIFGCKKARRCHDSNELSGESVVAWRVGLALSCLDLLNGFLEFFETQFGVF